MFFSLSSRAYLEVKWANIHKGNRLFYQTMHSNPQYNLILVIDGPVYLEVDGERTTLQSGEFMLLAPWQKHQGWQRMEEHSGFFWVQFTSDPDIDPIDDEVRTESEIRLLAPDMNDLRTASGTHSRLLIPQRFQTASRFEIMILFEKLLRELERPQGYFRIRVAVLLWTILEKLAEETLQHRNIGSALPASFLTYRRIVNLLEESYFQERTKDFYEISLNLTYEYVSNVFKKYAGITITTYLQLLRMQHAQNQLRQTTDSIQQIAHDVGYDDPYYFSKVFKKTVGVTPTEYRNRDTRSTNAKL